MIHRAYRLLTAENVTLNPSGQQALALLKQHIEKYPVGLMNKPAPAQVIAIIIMDDNVQMPRGLTQLLQTENVKIAMV